MECAATFCTLVACEVGAYRSHIGATVNQNSTANPGGAALDDALDQHQSRAMHDNRAGRMFPQNRAFDELSILRTLPAAGSGVSGSMMQSVRASLPPSARNQPRSRVLVICMLGASCWTMKSG
eukprot:7377214-Prymnesium_polylepis.2